MDQTFTSKKNIESSLAEMIRRERRARGHAQRDLAAEFGVAQATVARWESGGCVPGRHHAARLANYLGLTVEDVLAGRQGANAVPTLAGLTERVASLRAEIDLMMKVVKALVAEYERSRST